MLRLGQVAQPIEVPDAVEIVPDFRGQAVEQPLPAAGVRQGGGHEVLPGGPVKRPPVQIRRGERRAQRQDGTDGEDGEDGAEQAQGMVGAHPAVAPWYRSNNNR
jgi:hypothetical protein